MIEGGNFEAGFKTFGRYDEPAPEAEKTTTSEIIREAIRRFLEVA